MNDFNDGNAPTVGMAIIDPEDAALALELPPSLVIAHWVNEEMAELVQAAAESDEAGEIDAVYDALGALLLLLALYERDAIREGFHAYTAAQEKRGRPLMHWNATLATVAERMSGLGHERFVRESLTVYLTRARKARPDILALIAQNEVEGDNNG